MQCPPEVAAILQEILHAGLLQIRATAWTGDAEQCAVQADHLHNLPSILLHYSPERLLYYWDAERPGFIAQSAPDAVRLFEPLWNQLQPHVEEASQRASV
jgi:hypothetical protein